jgi:hypothetical protein
MQIWDELAEIGSLLKEPWLWIIILSLDAICIGPFIILWFFLNLPPQLRLLAVVLITVLWGIASGFKDWIKSKREEEKMRRRT